MRKNKKFSKKLHFRPDVCPLFEINHLFDLYPFYQKKLNQCQLEININCPFYSWESCSEVLLVPSAMERKLFSVVQIKKRKKCNPTRADGAKEEFVDRDSHVESLILAAVCSPNGHISWGNQEAF